MKLKTASPSAPRPYRQTARARAASARDNDILNSFHALLAGRWLDQFTLQDVARGAGVTQQTVIRKFGGKEGLLEALVLELRPQVVARRAVAPGDIARAIDVLMEDYDADGAFFMRLLSQEERFPVLRRFLDIGRREHRAWVERIFAPWLTRLKPAARNETLDALVAAMDLYVWQLLRRDLGFEPVRARAAMRRLVTGVLDGLGTQST